MSNFNKSKKYHFIYKTTCLLNDKYYVGMHSTNNLDDGYLGSGKRLRYSIRKYGKENFKLEILEFLPDRESLVERERELINEDLLRDDKCLNLKEGGNGGFSVETQKENAKKSKAKQKMLRETNPDWLKKYKENQSKAQLKVYETGIREKKQPMDWTGKKHTEETKRKMSESSKGKSEGKLNSQYGTCWITNEKENKKIKKGDNIPNGWRLGRVIKK